MKLFHVADIHLGRRRLDGRLPHSDLATAFGFVAEKAIEEKADVFLIAGDLFDRSRPGDSAVAAATRPICDVACSGIPVVIVPGNHERSVLPDVLLLAHPDSLCQA